jgi:dTDP-4-dehydrorhamnose reductase
MRRTSVCAGSSTRSFRRVLLSSWGGRLIHISTDCVFDGLRGSYTEDDVPNASDVYGRTKAMGEVHAENAITLRTSFIGRELRHHTSLLDWFLSQEGKTIAGYRNVIWSGVTTQHLAEVIETLVLRGTALTGVYHVSSGRISKHELLLKLRDAFDVDVHIETDDSVRRDLSLNGARFENALGYHCPTWSELITGLVDDPTPYPRLGIRASRVTNS